MFTPHTWTNGMGVTANAHLVAGIGDSPFLEYPFDPPEWDLSIRDFMMACPLTVDAEGWLNLSSAPGMGYELNDGAARADQGELDAETRRNNGMTHLFNRESGDVVLNANGASADHRRSWATDWARMP